MLAARAAMWGLGAVGVLVLLAGALDHAGLGPVRLDIPDAAIKLDPNATVRLDPGATLRLDPVARVGLSDTSRPSERQLSGIARLPERKG